MRAKTSGCVNNCWESSISSIINLIFSYESDVWIQFILAHKHIFLSIYIEDLSIEKHRCINEVICLQRICIIIINARILLVGIIAKSNHHVDKKHYIHKHQKLDNKRYHSSKESPVNIVLLFVKSKYNWFSKIVLTFY